jgi:hypothetical protein
MAWIHYIVRYALKHWRAWGKWRYQKKYFWFPLILNQKNLWSILIYQFEHLLLWSGTPYCGVVYNVEVFDVLFLWQKFWLFFRESLPTTERLWLFREDLQTHSAVDLRHFWYIFRALNVRKSRKQIMVLSILPKNDRKITILNIFYLGNTQNSDFLFVFWKNWGDHNLLLRLFDL